MRQFCIHPKVSCTYLQRQRTRSWQCRLSIPLSSSALDPTQPESERCLKVRNSWFTRISRQEMDVANFCAISTCWWRNNQQTSVCSCKNAHTNVIYAFYIWHHSILYHLKSPENTTSSCRHHQSIFPHQRCKTLGISRNRQVAQGRLHASTCTWDLICSQKTSVKTNGSSIP